MRFTCYHECEVKPLLDWLAVHLVWQCCKAHIFLVLVLKNGHKGEIMTAQKWACKVFIHQSKHSMCTPVPTKMWQVVKVSSTTAEAALPSQSPSHKLLHQRKTLISCVLFPHQALFKSLLHAVNCNHQPEHITVLQQRHRSFPSLGLLAGLSHVTSLLLYGSNRPQGLLGLAGLMLDKSNSTLLLCGKLGSEPESDCALPATGGRKYDGVCGRSSPSASLSASWGLWPWCWWCLCSWWWCPPWWWGSCIMFSTSESSDWLEC